MSRAGENAGRICAWLRAQPEVDRVVYLGFPEKDRQRDIYERHCTGAGSTFSLYLEGGETVPFAFPAARTIPKRATRLGGNDTEARNPAAMRDLPLPADHITPRGRA